MASNTNSSDSDPFINEVRNFIKVVTALKMHKVDISSREGLTAAFEILCLGLQEFKVNCAPKENTQSCGDQVLPVKTEKVQSCGDQVLPVKTEKVQSCGDPELPFKTEKAQSCGDPDLPVKTEKAQHCGDPDLPVKTEKVQSCGDPDLTVKTEKAQSCGDPDLPVKTKMAQSCRDQVLPVKTEKVQSCGDPELPVKTEKAQSCGDPDLPVKTEMAQSCRDQVLPVKTEKVQSCGDPELPVKTEKVQSCGDQVLPVKTEKVQSCGDPELPVKTEKVQSCGDQVLPVKTEKAQSCGDPKLPVKTEKAQSCGDPETPVKTKKTHNSCNKVEAVIEKSIKKKGKESDGPSKATINLATSYLQQLWDDIQEEFIMKENDLEIMLKDYGDILIYFSVTKLREDMKREGEAVANCVLSLLCKLSQKLEKILEVIVWNENQQEIQVEKDQTLPDKKLNKEKDHASSNKILDKKKNQDSQPSARIHPTSKGLSSTVTIGMILCVMGICDIAGSQSMNQEYVSGDSIANLKSIYEYLFPNEFSAHEARKTENTKNKKPLKGNDSFKVFASKYLMKTKKKTDYIISNDIMKYYSCWCNLEGKVPSSTITAGRILGSMGICANRRVGGSLSEKRKYAYTCVAWTNYALLEELIPKVEQEYKNTTDNINMSSTDNINKSSNNSENSSEQHQPTENTKSNLSLKGKDSFKEFASKYLMKTKKETDYILREDLMKYYRCWCNLEGKVPSSTITARRILCSMGIRANRRVGGSLSEKRKYTYTCVAWTNYALLEELVPKVKQEYKNTTDNINKSSNNSENSSEQHQPTKKTKNNRSLKGKDSFKEFASKYLMKTKKETDYILCEDLMKYYSCWCNLEGKVPSSTITAGRILCSMGIRANRRVGGSLSEKRKYAYTCVAWTNYALLEELVPKVEQELKNTTDNINKSSTDNINKSSNNSENFSEQHQPTKKTKNNLSLKGKDSFKEFASKYLMKTNKETDYILREDLMKHYRHWCQLEDKVRLSIKNVEVILNAMSIHDHRCTGGSQDINKKDIYTCVVWQESAHAELENFQYY